MQNLNQYSTLIFDCDGVILNSNFQKIEAYRSAALKFGADTYQANALVKYHIELTGISRNIKFHYFLETILGRKVTEEDMNFLLQSLNNEVISLLKNCEITLGLEELKKQTQSTTWIVASGGNQEELRFLFSDKKINHLFDGGIFGSPKSKHEIIENHILNNIKKLIRKILEHSVELDFYEGGEKDPTIPCLSAAELTGRGWKTEAIPIVQTKKSLITRIFSSLFQH